MVADDPLGLAETANLGGDVHLEVDVVDPQSDRLAEQLLPLLLVAPPEAAVDPPPDREDHRRRAILEDPLQIRIAAQTVDSQFDQLDARARPLPSTPRRATSAGLARSSRRSSATNAPDPRTPPALSCHGNA